jgi:hypothetical protein
MANTASVHERGEFWRPPTESRQEGVSQVATETCTRCNSELMAGSRFCHVCGTERATEFSRRGWTQYLDVHLIQDRLGLSLASVVAFIIGVICALAAIGTGLIFTANTVLDWQAVQVWRIEWLLAAVVAFLAGILLNRSSRKAGKHE